MATWKEFKEHSVKSGLGTGLCYMLPNETKYHILSAVTSLPSFAGEPNTIEYSTTTNKNITYVPGKNTTNNVEITIPYNLDNITLCQKIKDVKCKYAYIDFDDFSAGLFVATARYRMSDVGTDDVKTITISLTVHSWEEDIADDVYEFYEDTVSFEDTIPSFVRLAKGESVSYTIAVEPAETTITAVSSDSESSNVVATYTKPTLKIEAKSSGVAGSYLVTVSATSAGYASNERKIKVIVEE